MAIVRKKIWPEYFDAVGDGEKKAELRLNDFDIREGDTLVLEEWDPKTASYTGRSIEKQVSHVAAFKLNAFGQADQIKKKGILLISFE